MKDYGLIRESYLQVEKYYIKTIDDAVAQENDAEYLKLIELSRINEYAYFILFWGQFESFINDKAFDIESDEYKEKGFMLRVQLAVPTTHEFYSKIDQYYYWRCELAHGNISKFPELTLSTIFDKIEEITDKIQNNSLPLGDSFFDLFNN